MKLDAKSLAGIGAVVAAAVVFAWFAMRPGQDEATPRGSGGTAVLQQPSGKVTAAGEAEDVALGTADSDADPGKTTGGGTTAADAGSGDAADGAERTVALDPDADTGTPEAGEAGDKSPVDASENGAGDNDPAASAGEKAGADGDGDPGAPRFDVVRIDRDGQAVLAGRAQPNQRVEILLDGKVIETVETDRAGAFVAILETKLTGAAQNLQLRVRAPADHVTGSGATHDAAAVGGASRSDGEGKTPDDAPRIAAASPDLARPKPVGSDAVAAGRAGNRVRRFSGGTAPAAPARLPGGIAAPRQGTAPDTAGDAPAVLGAVSRSEARLRTGAAERPFGVTRSSPSNVAPSRKVAPFSAAPAGSDALPRSADPDDLTFARSGDKKARPGAAEQRVISDRISPSGASTDTATGKASEPSIETDTVSRSAGPDGLAAAPGPDGQVRPGATDRPVAGARSDPEATATVESAEAAPQTPVAVATAESRYLTSAPIIILPGDASDAAPTLLTTTRRDHKILQPSVSDINSVVLDRISYGDTGDVVLTGRGLAGRAVRVYGNGLIIGTTRIASDGTWTLSVDEERGQAIRLLRLDELNAEGRVTTRVEAPFTYSRSEPKEVRQRQVVVQKGDALWRIAEQYYGEGLRYSVIYGANTTLIRDPDLIYPGQVFSVPELVDAVPER